MKAILQRVASASVTVDAQLVSSIGKGLLVFAAVSRDDTPKEVESMAAKVLKFKMWPSDDEEAGSKGQWKQNVQDIEGEILCVSQFTLMAGTKKNRPDFHEAASGEKAKELYDYFFGRVQALYVTDKVKNGVFQAMMQVDLRNDGPVCRYHSKDSRVTIEIETNPIRPDAETQRVSETRSKHEELPMAELLD